MKKSFSLLACVFLVLVTTNLYCQEKPSFELKVVKDPDGSIYWPLSLPVYMQLSSQPDLRDSVSLTKVKNEDMKEFGIPLKWDGPGIHYLRHFDKPRLFIRNKELFINA